MVIWPLAVVCWLLIYRVTGCQETRAYGGSQQILSEQCDKTTHFYPHECEKITKKFSQGYTLSQNAVAFILHGVIVIFKWDGCRVASRPVSHIWLPRASPTTGGPTPASHLFWASRHYTGWPRSSVCQDSLQTGLWSRPSANSTLVTLDRSGLHDELCSHTISVAQEGRHSHI